MNSIVLILILSSIIIFLSSFIVYLLIGVGKIKKAIKEIESGYSPYLEIKDKIINKKNNLDNIFKKNQSSS